MIVELALDHLLRRLDDGIADLRIEMVERHVGFGSGAFDDPEGAHNGQRLLFPADSKIAERALSLRAPIFVGRNFDGAECIGLGARRGLQGLYRSEISRRVYAKDCQINKSS